MEPQNTLIEARYETLVVTGMDSILDSASRNGQRQRFWFSYLGLMCMQDAFVDHSSVKNLSTRTLNYRKFVKLSSYR